MSHLPVLDAQVGHLSIRQTRSTTRTYTVVAYSVDPDGNVAEEELDLTPYPLAVVVDDEPLNPAPVVDGGHWTFSYTAPDQTANFHLDMYIDGALAATGILLVTRVGTQLPDDELTLRLLEPDSILVHLRMSAGGAGATYVHVQSAPAATWTIVHNLGFYPDVAIIVGGREVDADVEHGSTSQLTITFPTPTAGIARLT